MVRKALKILVLIALLTFLLLPGEVLASDDDDQGQNNDDQGQNNDDQGQDGDDGGAVSTQSSTLTITGSDF